MGGKLAVYAGRRRLALLPGLLVLLVGAASQTASAAPLQRDEVPEPLAPWVDWALRGHETERCPFLHGETGETRRACVWPSRLVLDLSEKEGRFTQEWLVHHESLVLLPGDERRWPQDVRANGKPISVVARGQRPAVRLGPGRHELTGKLYWDAPPELLQIPARTGIVRLTLRGREVPLPKRDARGRLWLQKRASDPNGGANGAGPGGAEQRLEVSAHRRIRDSVPLRLETRVELRVAGRSREVVLGQALPAGFTPLSLSSQLPARLDPDGRLRVQVRPGTWSVRIDARHQGPVREIALPEPGGPWDDAEIWVFEAQPQLRLVTVEEGVPVDPSQTMLPDDWKHLPAYLMEPGRKLVFDEKRRGDADPAPDELKLARTLWLDFDGGGYTVSDRLQGVVNRSTRLEMAPATELGRVAVNGSDALITRLDEAPTVGVEVPRGTLELAADSRVTANGAGIFSKAVPAVGWAHDVQALEGRLHLPPGWRLLHASGVDRATSTWLNRWSLFDLFAVLVLAMAFGRLWGVPRGALALVALTLIWTEPGAPHWAWAAVLVAEGLHRGVPAGRFPRVARGVEISRGAALALLLLVSIPFAVQQVRGGLFPALERPAIVPAPAVLQQVASEEDWQAEAELGVERKAGGLASRPLLDEYASDAPARKSVPRSARLQRYRPDPQAKITTGPGLPSWQWQSVALHWSGPVAQDQELRLVLMPPGLNGVLAFARVALLAALLLAALGVSAAAAGRWLRGGAAAAGVSLALLLGVPDARADIPSRELLAELRARLLEAPECAPRCAASPRLLLDVKPLALRARIEVHAAAETAVPLPGGSRGWSPERVLVDGDPAEGLRLAADGTLWVHVTSGRHQLVVEGPLPDRDSFELSLPLRPHRVVARTEGWTLHGVHEDGVAEQNLQLTRIREDEPDEPDAPGAAPGPGDSRAAGELPPFVRVEREIRLGLEWQVETTVTRVSQADAALVLELPLLPGESVTTAGIRADGDAALVSMGPGVGSVAWTSLLTERPQLVLRATEAAPAAEVWRLDTSPIWHVEPSGIAPVHQPSPEGARIREWRPWPGEQVVLRVLRPEGVAGATATIDASRLALTPGLRATDASLGVTLRSSRGGQHVFTLPEGAVLQRVAVDDETQPIRQEERRVSVPLRPGTQRVELQWREPRGARTLVYAGSQVDLGLPSVNAELRITPSPARWTLLTGGPRLGPAVLFWPLLLVFAGIAAGLARLCAATELAPLRFHHWLLLGVGLTQVPVTAGALVVAWLLALGWRRRHGTAVPGLAFDLLQLGLAGLSLVAIVVLFVAIEQGLLGQPVMQIAGNGSDGSLLRWFQDRSDAALPQPWVLSVPLLVYRLAMLGWALWLALALVRWLRWGWSCFSEGELWRPIRRRRVAEPGPEPAGT